MLRFPRFRYSDHTSWQLGLVVLICFVIFYVTVNAIYAKRMPRNLVLQKTHILTLLDEHRESPKAIFEFQHDEQTYYGWIGHATARPRLRAIRVLVPARGADVYVFNHEGILVDFTEDVEKHSQFKLKWMHLWTHYITKAESISVEELKQRFPDFAKK